MPRETLRVWLISKEIKALPRKVRAALATNFDLRCPVPPFLTLPARNGEPVQTFIRRFALINGGENGYVIAVYYIESEK